MSYKYSVTLERVLSLGYDPFEQIKKVIQNTDTGKLKTAVEEHYRNFEIGFIMIPEFCYETQVRINELADVYNEKFRLYGQEIDALNTYKATSETINVNTDYPENYAGVGNFDSPSGANKNNTQSEGYNGQPIELINNHINKYKDIVNEFIDEFKDLFMMLY